MKVGAPEDLVLNGAFAEAFASEGIQFDTALGAFIYGGWDRSTLESMITGKSVDGIDSACLLALTVENGVATGVVADPSPDAVRACSDISYSSEPSFGSVNVPVVEGQPLPVTAETLAPLTTNPARVRF